MVLFFCLKNYIPLSLLVTDFETVRYSALETQKVSLNSNDQFEVKGNSQDVFDQHQINLVGTVLGKTKEKETSFILKSNLIFNVTKRIISFVEVKKRNTWRKIYIDEPFVLNFADNGLQTVPYKIHFTDGTIFSQSFINDVQCQNRAVESKESTVFKPRVVTTISSTIPYQGYGESMPLLEKENTKFFLIL